MVGEHRHPAGTSTQSPGGRASTAPAPGTLRPVPAGCSRHRLRGTGAGARAGGDPTLLRPVCGRAVRNGENRGTGDGRVLPADHQSWHRGDPGFASAITAPGRCPLGPPEPCRRQERRCLLSTASPCQSFLWQKLHREGGLGSADRKSRASPTRAVPEDVPAAPRLHGQLRNAPRDWEQAPRQRPGSRGLRQAARVPPAAPTRAGRAPHPATGLPWARRRSRPGTQGSISPCRAGSRLLDGDNAELCPPPQRGEEGALRGDRRRESLSPHSCFPSTRSILPFPAQGAARAPSPLAGSCPKAVP